jgi:hypothetical protein
LLAMSTLTPYYSTTTQLLLVVGIKTGIGGRFDWMSDEESDIELTESATKGFSSNVISAHEYARFIAMFANCFISADKDTASYKPVSECVTVSLEAFAVALYVNHYSRLMKEYWDSSQEDGASTISGISDASLPNALFTSEARGGGKYNGWKEEGYLFYNNVFSVLKQERRPQTEARKRLEGKVRKIMQNSRKRGSKRKIGESLEVSNELDELVNMVSV